jgi:proteasome activator subunit 4
MAGYSHPLSVLCEKITSGWLAWAPTIDLFTVPQGSSSLVNAWDVSQGDCIAVYRKQAADPDFWKALAKHFSAENHAEVISQDHVSCVKSICKLDLLMLLLWYC